MTRPKAQGSINIAQRANIARFEEQVSERVARVITAVSQTDLALSDIRRLRRCSSGHLCHQDHRICRACEHKLLGMAVELRAFLGHPPRAGPPQLYRMAVLVFRNQRLPLGSLSSFDPQQFLRAAARQLHRRLPGVSAVLGIDLTANQVEGGPEDGRRYWQPHLNVLIKKRHVEALKRAFGSRLVRDLLTPVPWKTRGVDDLFVATNYTVKLSLHAVRGRLQRWNGVDRYRMCGSQGRLELDAYEEFLNWRLQHSPRSLFRLVGIGSNNESG